jgi:hypothetical protein
VGAGAEAAEEPVAGRAVTMGMRGPAGCSGCSRRMGPVPAISHSRLTSVSWASGAAVPSIRTA